MKRNNSLRLMTASGIMASVIFLLTAYLHIPSHTGYTHIGDAFVYLSACLLPTPYAVFAGAIGATLADCLTGFAIWAPASAVIKGLTCLFFSSKCRKIICVRNLLSLIPAWALCIGGYFVYDAIITGTVSAAVLGIPGYVTQCIASSIVFIAVGLSFDRLSIKSKFI
ncbi:MAG: TIGR04002 family protein [Oscillospiraceae bacterium]|nr:TIGR04002 family protein [Oscillospiraceae bacterium]